MRETRFSLFKVCRQGASRYSESATMRTPPTSKVKPTLAAVGAVIRKRREDIGLSQDELGYLADLHRTYIGSVERGERNVTLGSLIAICGALQLQPHELLRRSGI